MSAALCIAGGDVQISQEIEVTPEGARLIQTYSDDGILYETTPSDGYVSPATVFSERWEETDGGLAWICDQIAVGDNGAMAMAGKYLNNEAFTMYMAGDATPVWNYDTLGSERTYVGMADRASNSAALTIVDMDPDPGIYDFVGTLDAFDNTGNGTPNWSYTFPGTENYFGGGVALSDDGKIIVAWKANPITETLLVEAFDSNGNSISSGEVSTENAGTTYFNARQARLSDDGRRAYFFIGVEAIIYDVFDAAVLYEHYIGASFDSHAFSGDGNSFAYGSFGYYRVYNESAPGTWSQVASQSFSGSTYVARLALNQDGSRVGYMVQQYSPAYDHIEVGMYDVANSTAMFDTAYDAPGTIYQLVCAGIELDDAGDYLAACSWGDSLNATPEAFAYDASGSVTCELDLGGSAFTIGFDADGDVFATGSKGVHANEMGSGGAVTVSDANDQTLHVTGYPTVGGSLTIEVADVGTEVKIAACNSLGSTVTPFGITEVDLGTLMQVLGPYTIPTGGLSLSVNVPSNPALAGNDVHLQGLITGGSSPILTNKVSLRIQ